MLKAKLNAMLIHAIFTVLIALFVSFLVYGLWYPNVFSQIMSGTKLFLLIMSVEVVLGPCMSLIIFNPQKALHELVFDYALVGIIQISALIYGLVSVIGSRPAYIVFVKDRLEVVAATEIDDKARQEASAERFKSVPLTGPEFICVRPPLSTQEREQLLFIEIPKGRDVQHLPRFYKPCLDGEVFSQANPKDKLLTLASARGLQQITDRLSAEGDFRWLPIHGKQAIWVAILKPSQNIPFEYIAIDPY